jgi:hypothetical protein
VSGYAAIKREVSIMSRPVVRLVYEGRTVEEREMDRVPVVGETVEFSQSLPKVVRVIWRLDGGASS